MNTVRKRTTPNTVMSEVISSLQIRSPQDWKSIREDILTRHKLISLANIDALTLGTCTDLKKYDLALSYLKFLKDENVSLNIATIGKYFKLLYSKNVDGISQEDEKEIINLYNSVRQSYPVLDNITMGYVIQAISVTSNWKLCFDLLRETKIIGVPTAAVYNAVIAAAFLNNSEELAWKYFEEMLDLNRSVEKPVYASYFRALNDNKKAKQKIEELFLFMQKQCIQIDEPTSHLFLECLHKNRFYATSSQIVKRGVCKNCNGRLQTFELNDDEFLSLKNKILENVIVGKDVFTKTTPEELGRFKQFLSTIESFDVIIDGLNVAYSAGVEHSPMVTSALVSAVVSHFVKQNNSVLVLGRKHMNKWPKENWTYVLRNASVFLTENLSQDDPYLLYCALQSGKQTAVVTRDLMRSHKFLLKDNNLRLLFDKWLMQNQFLLLRVQDNGIPIFKEPLSYTPVVQKNDNFWHIPIISPNSVLKKYNQFLCVKI